MLKKSEDTLHRLVWLFTLGSLAGFWMESLQSWIDLGYVENRQGLLYGPFTPIYGLGALLFALGFPALRTRQVGFIFTITGAAGALFEYFCSLFQETAFGTISWEYSNIGLDWHGRTNLILALCWGGLGVFFTLAFYPAFARYVDRQPRQGRRLLTLLLLCFFLSNGLLSAAALVRQSQRRADIPAFNTVASFLDLHFPDERLETTFPNMAVVPSFSQSGSNP